LVDYFAPNLASFRSWTNIVEVSLVMVLIYCGILVARCVCIKCRWLHLSFCISKYISGSEKTKLLSVVAVLWTTYLYSKSIVGHYFGYNNEKWKCLDKNSYKYTIVYCWEVYKIFILITIWEWEIDPYSLLVDSYQNVKNRSNYVCMHLHVLLCSGS